MDNKTRKEIKDKFLEILSNNHIISAVCKKVGIPRATFYRWIDEDENFKKDCVDTKMMGIKAVNDFCESNLINKIKDGNLSAMKYWLEAHNEVYAFAKNSKKGHTWYRNKIKNSLDALDDINYDEDNDLL